MPDNISNLGSSNVEAPKKSKILQTIDDKKRLVNQGDQLIKGGAISIVSSFEYSELGEISKEFENFCENNMWSKVLVSEISDEGEISLVNGLKNEIKLNKSDSFILDKFIKNKDIKKVVSDSEKQLSELEDTKKLLCSLSPEKKHIIAEQFDTSIQLLKTSLLKIKQDEFNSKDGEIYHLDEGSVSLKVGVEKKIIVKEEVSVKTIGDIEDMLNLKGIDSIPLFYGANVDLNEIVYSSINSEYKLSCSFMKEGDNIDENLRLINSFGFNFSKKGTNFIEDDVPYNGEQLSELLARAWRIEQDSDQFEIDDKTGMYIFQSTDNLNSYLEGNGFIPDNFFMKFPGSSIHKEIEKDVLYSDLLNKSGQIEGEKILEKLVKEEKEIHSINIEDIPF